MACRSESHDDIRSIEDFSDVSSSEEMHEMKQDVHVDHYDINSITEQFSQVNVALRLSHIPGIVVKMIILVEDMSFNPT